MPRAIAPLPARESTKYIKWSVVFSFIINNVETIFNLDSTVQNCLNDVLVVNDNENVDEQFNSRLN